MSFESMLWRNLAITCAVESAALAMLLRRRDLRLWRCCALVNALTNPLAAAAVVMLAAPFWNVEAVVCAVEWLLYGLWLDLGWKRALTSSLFANGLTIALCFV